MPGRLFVATLGFNETFIISTINAYSASSGDGLVTVTLSPVVGGVEKALGNLRGLASALGFTMYDPILIDRDAVVDSITRMVDKLTVILDSGGYKHVIADLTGGPRIVVVSTLIALLSLSSQARVDVRIQDETGGLGELRFNIDLLKIALRGLGEKGKLLEYIVSHPGVRPGSIAEDLGLAPKTVANYLTYLKKLGLVYQKGRGRGLYPTEWGVLVASLWRREGGGGGQ